MPESAKPNSSCADVPPELAHHPKYRIVRELGRGGMGIVYEARQTGMMDRQVVIKVINRSLIDNPEVLARFRREVKAASQLAHPNIVIAYNAELAGDLHLLVMELVLGHNLADVLDARGPLPLASACHYIRQAARALQHAHERGMVHRDIKPENLMLTPEGQIKVLDFGIAKVVSEQNTGTGLTASNSYVGTPEYSAPEQATDAHSADIRADLYSLGCTLYCLLAGRPPFQEATAMKTLLAHLQKEPQPLTQLRPDVPEDLWRVVSRLLAKEPRQRYQTPSEVVQVLAPFVTSSAKPEAKSGSVPVVAAAEKGTLLAGETYRIKNDLREEPGQTPSEKVPAQYEASPLAAPVNRSARPRKAKRARESTRRVPAGWYRRWPVLAGGGVLLLALVGLWASGVFKAPGPRNVSNPLPDLPKADGGASNLSPLAGQRSAIMDKQFWKIENDTLVGTGAKGNEGIVFGDSTWKNYTFSFDAKKLDGTKPFGVGALIRASDLRTYYKFGYGGYQNGEWSELVRLVHGQWSRGHNPREMNALCRKIKPMETGRWCSFAVTVNGTEITCHVDGLKMFTWKDNAHACGKVGLTVTPGPFAFRAIKVTAPDGKVLWEGLPELPN